MIRSVLPVPTLSIVAVVVALTSGCIAPPTNPEGTWRLDWEVRHESRYLDAQAASLLSSPARIAGGETWWVAPDRLVIAARGQLADGEDGALITWILFEEGWVFHLDPDSGEVAAMSLGRFDEERRRRSRELMWATVEAEHNSGDLRFYNLFRGDLALERHTSYEGKRWLALAAVPGRAWHLRGKAKPRLDLPRLSLGYAFEPVDLDRAESVATVIARVSPRIIEEIGLPSGGSSLVLRRELQSLKPSSLEEAMQDFPDLQAARFEMQEAEWQDPEKLWSYLGDPEARPGGLDLRGVRLRLEEVVTRDDVERIETLLAQNEDMQAQEELAMLLHAADSRAFDRVYRGALERGDLGQIIPLVSVLSLRRPGSVPQKLEKLRAKKGAWWKGVDPEQARSALLWFEALERWLST